MSDVTKYDPDGNAYYGSEPHIGDGQGVSEAEAIRQDLIVMGHRLGKVDLSKYHDLVNRLYELTEQGRYDS